jgi:hypothetical protein
LMVIRTVRILKLTQQTGQCGLIAYRQHDSELQSLRAGKRSNLNSLAACDYGASMPSRECLLRQRWDSEQHERHRTNKRGTSWKRLGAPLSVHCVPPMSFETAHDRAEQLCARCATKVRCNPCERCLRRRRPERVVAFFCSVCSAAARQICKLDSPHSQFRTLQNRNSNPRKHRV